MICRLLPSLSLSPPLNSSDPPTSSFVGLRSFPAVFGVDWSVSVQFGFPRRPSAFSGLCVRGRGAELRDWPTSASFHRITSPGEHTHTLQVSSALSTRIFQPQSGFKAVSLWTLAETGSVFEFNRRCRHAQCVCVCYLLYSGTVCVCVCLM